MNALLDTHILLWWHGDRGRLSRDQQDVIAAANADSPLQVSDISLWEVAMLHCLGRIRLTIPLREWLEKAVAPPLVRRHGISPAVANRVGFVAGFLSSRPGRPHSRGNRPCVRRDTSDPGPQNHRSRTGQHAELILRSWLFFS